MRRNVNRRDFLKVAALALSGGFVRRYKNDRPARLDDATTFGYQSAEDNPYFRVYLDGEDVSGQCHEFDDREGWVGLYAKISRDSLLYPLHQFRVYGHVRAVSTKGE